MHYQKFVIDMVSLAWTRLNLYYIEHELAFRTSYKCQQYWVGCLVQDKLNLKQVYVITISVVTVALWCANSWLQRWTGEMGIIAILPLVAFFGFGILGKVQFQLPYITKNLTMVSIQIIKGKVQFVMQDHVLLKVLLCGPLHRFLLAATG